MTGYETIQLHVGGPLASITLAREKVRNAMNIRMIRELVRAFDDLNQNEEIRIILLRAEGEHFSAGADLNWMREGLGQSPEQLLAESRELAGLFSSIHRSEHVVVTAVRGKVMGGANGLVAASDIVVVEETAAFAFSEIKLGLIPATISPFVLRKMGYSRTKELMLTGRLFHAKEAVEYGLAHVICGKGKLEETADAVIKELLSNGPRAMKGIKSLLDTLDRPGANDRLSDLTAELIAKYRSSEEGQEGISAFFEKRKPGWHEAN
ncbi:MAG TPA: enoyl-CoA hydratase/isomerase family protein [Bacteroides sp.]|nr:enoyl-CoA hydratase/isomerase family protein [Bacteroides sp.]